MWEHIEKEDYIYAWEKKGENSGITFVGVKYIDSDYSVLFDMASGFYVYICKDNMYRKISDCFTNRDDAMLFVDNYIEADLVE